MTYNLVFAKYNRKKKKYGNKTQIYNGLSYHSIKEANYAEDLDWRLKAKDIKSWTRQVKIDLKVNGQHICNYYVDFKVIHNDNSVEYVEVKGFATPEWQLKWRLFEALISEIDKGAVLTVYK